MIKRQVQSKCQALANQYPVITITGPRQSGKTTLAKRCFPKKPYVNLENPDERNLAIEDPRAFLNRFPSGAILDEIQRVPDIPSYLQQIVDESSKKGLFILTGSQQFEISNTISQSLAGRTALIKLLPLSLQEVSTLKEPKTVDTVLLNGFYPRIYNEKIEANNFFMNYFETYVQRDVRQLSQIDNLHLFEKFVRLLSGRIGQLLNYNSIANDLGVSQPTIKKWISLLEASYIIFLLPPFYQNIGKRLIKTPKLYFYDVGFASHLLGIENQKQIQNHPLRGNLFENFIVIEYVKSRFNKAKKSNLYFFRDRTGNEVDLVMEEALSLTPIEIKSTQTIHKDFLKGLTFFHHIFPEKIKKSLVIYGGNTKQSMAGTDFFPWNKISF